MSIDHSGLLDRRLQESILILDGAMGTMIQKYNLDEAGYRGQRFADWEAEVKGNNDLLTLSQPEIISEIHSAYLEAGADIIETNTFNANRISLADYKMASLAKEINFKAAAIAKEAALSKTTSNPDRPRFVAGVLGPTNRTASLSPDVNDPGFRNVTFDKLRSIWGKIPQATREEEEQIEISAHYSGYLEKQEADIIAFRRDENLAIPENMDYSKLSGLSNEVKSKFRLIRPKTLGQALRIDGITPAAAYILLSHLKKGNKKLKRA